MKKRQSCNQDCTLCTSEVCAGKGKKCDYLHKQYAMKKWVFHLIVITISLGAIVPFASEVLCTIWFPEASLGLNTWNQFVSIILGIIATILSIVSIIMGFKNYEDTLSVQEKYMQALEQISGMAKDLNNVRAVVSDLSALKYKYNVDAHKTNDMPGDWEKEQKFHDVQASEKTAPLSSIGNTPLAVEDVMDFSCSTDAPQ